jgi:uncharacterized protein with HEPN domain
VRTPLSKIHTSRRRCFMTEKSCSKREIGNLHVIIGYCEDIRHLTQLHGSAESDFHDNISLQYSCVFSLIQIGEAIKKLPNELRDGNKEVDWKGLAGLRDKIAHAYGEIDVSMIRMTVLDEIPFLEKVCRNMAAGI